ncbi:Uncharacterised protein [uncultured Butyricicoccus sp.]|nr:Uncharacterised protein [uncultured Butyricicoccus sp.]
MAVALVQQQAVERLRHLGAGDVVCRAEVSGFIAYHVSYVLSGVQHGGNAGAVRVGHTGNLRLLLKLHLDRDRRAGHFEGVFAVALVGQRDFLSGLVGCCGDALHHALRGDRDRLTGRGLVLVGVRCAAAVGFHMDGVLVSGGGTTSTAAPAGTAATVILFIDNRNRVVGGYIGKGVAVSGQAGRGIVHGHAFQLIAAVGGKGDRLVLAVLHLHRAAGAGRAARYAHGDGVLYRRGRLGLGFRCGADDNIAAHVGNVHLARGRIIDGGIGGQLHAAHLDAHGFHFVAAFRRQGGFIGAAPCNRFLRTGAGHMGEGIADLKGGLLPDGIQGHGLAVLVNQAVRKGLVLLDHLAGGGSRPAGKGVACHGISKLVLRQVLGFGIPCHILHGLHRTLAAVGVELDGAGIGPPCALERHCYVSCVTELLGVKQAGGVDGVGLFVVRAGINSVTVRAAQRHFLSADGQGGHPAAKDVVVRVLQNGNDGMVIAHHDFLRMDVLLAVARDNLARQFRRAVGYMLRIILAGVLVCHRDFGRAFLFDFPCAGQGQVVVRHGEARFAGGDGGLRIRAYPAAELIIVIAGGGLGRDAHRVTRSVYTAMGQYRVGRHLTGKGIGQGMLVRRLRLCTVLLIPQAVHVGDGRTGAVLRIGDSVPVGVSVAPCILALVGTGNGDLDFVAGIKALKGAAQDGTARIRFVQVGLLYNLPALEAAGGAVAVLNIADFNICFGYGLRHLFG